MLLREERRLQVSFAEVEQDDDKLVGVFARRAT
jgi:hypothetical protein